MTDVAANPTDSLTVRDNRTGQEYDIPITDGTINAKDLGKIRTLLMAMGERLLRLEQQIPSLQASSQAPLIPSMNDGVTHRATPSSWDGITRSPSFHGPVRPGRSFLLDDLSSRRLPPLAPMDDARWISTPQQHRSPTSTDALSRAPSVWARHASTGL